MRHPTFARCRGAACVALVVWALASRCRVRGATRDWALGRRYPCIKDLSRLGRDLARTVLVDDTPLAFCRQPDNGIPVFNFRCGGARRQHEYMSLSRPT